MGYLRKKRKHMIGQLLLRGGEINEAQLSAAIKEQEETGGYLGAILIDRGFVTITTITKYLAIQKKIVSKPHLLYK